MLVIKSGQYGILEKLGIDAASIAELKKNHVKIGVGAEDISFYLGSDLLSTANFQANLSELVKDPAAHSIHAGLLVGAAINAALDKIKQGAAGVSQTTIVAGPEFKQAWSVAVAEKSAPSAQSLSEAAKELPIAILKDAASLYQRVRGTSDGSVYCVVAMGSGIKVAARYHSQNRLSMRVEGALTPQIKATFANHNFQLGKGGAYMSMHCICENVPADRVVGAVLTGVGVEFETPLPTLAKVRALTK